MKIILTEVELTGILREHYPVPSGYTVSDVEFRKHSLDFCTVAFERTDIQSPEEKMPF